MANKEIFCSTRGKSTPQTDTFNEAGGRAYDLGPKLGLATLAATGCVSNTFYASASDQLTTVLDLCSKNSPEFIGKVAIYTRKQSFMKDMPALLCAHLTTRGDEGRRVLEKVFPVVIDNGKMLRNFVQILRSGVTGRKSLGSMPKRLVQSFLTAKDPEWLFRQSVGQAPSMSDIIKMVHPRATDPTQESLFGYLVGRDVDKRILPPLVQQFEYWKQDTTSRELPAVPFQMLTAQQLSPEQWMEIAVNGGWHMVRMNLNTFARHGVFKSTEVTSAIISKLRDPSQIKKSRVFPYQLLAAYMNVGSNVPAKVKDALHDAMEIATENIPEIPGRVIVFPDVSGSMSHPVTGQRKGATTRIRCIDVAGLFASAILRRNIDALVVPIDTRVHPELRLEPRDTVMTNTTKLAAYHGGGTALGHALTWANQTEKAGDVIVFISDYESWGDSYGWRYSGTLMMQEFRKFQIRNRNAKLVCLDINPTSSSQGHEGDDVLNVAGFSDTVFSVISAFAQGGKDHWVDVIEKITL